MIGCAAVDVDADSDDVAVAVAVVAAVVAAVVVLDFANAGATYGVDVDLADVIARAGAIARASRVVRDNPLTRAS